MQENRQKSAKFLHFVRKIGGNGRNGEKKNHSSTRQGNTKKKVREADDTPSTRRGNTKKKSTGKQ